MLKLVVLVASFLYLLYLVSVILYYCFRFLFERY